MSADGSGGWEDLFWLVFKQTRNPVAVLDEDRRFVDLNDASLALFGRSRGELLRRRILDIIKPEEHPVSTREWEAFRRTGAYSGTRTFVRGDGVEVTMDFAARLAKFDQGQRAVYVILNDSAQHLIPVAAKNTVHLTPREREVVALIAMGHETRDIADKLHLSPETVRTHVRNAMGRLEVHTRAQLVCTAMTGDQSLDLLRSGDG